MVAGSLTTVVRDTASNEWHSSRFTFELIALPHRPVVENNKTGEVVGSWSGLVYSVSNIEQLLIPGKIFLESGPG